MKRLYSFEHDYVTTTKVPEKKGKDEVLVEKKETSKRKLFLRKPSRSMIDDSEFFQKKEYNRCVKAGILTATQVSRDINNDGGVFSEDQKKKIDKATEELKELVSRKREIDDKKKKTKKEEDELKEILKEIDEKLDLIEELQNLSNRVFENTAESYARNRLVNWWLVHLLFEEKDGSIEPFFGNGDESEKFEKYDEYEDEENEDFSLFFESLVKRSVQLVVFWFMSEETPSQEVFEQIDPYLKKKEKEKEEKLDEQKSDES